jgi:hypothetical protein
MTDQAFADFLDAELFGSDDPEAEAHPLEVENVTAEAVEGP